MPVRWSVLITAEALLVFTFVVWQQQLACTSHYWFLAGGSFLWGLNVEPWACVVSPQLQPVTSHCCCLNVADRRIELCHG